MLESIECIGASLRDLKARHRLSLRQLEQTTQIPRSTLSYLMQRDALYKSHGLTRRTLNRLAAINSLSDEVQRIIRSFQKVKTAKVRTHIALQRTGAGRSVGRVQSALKSLGREGSPIWPDSEPDVFACSSSEFTILR